MQFKVKNAQIERVNAIVITEDHYNALGVIRSLGEQQITVNVVLTTTDKSFIECSKYISQLIKTNHQENEILNAIQTVASNSQIVYFLFPLSDYAAAILDKYHSQFDTNVIVPSLLGNLSKYSDKYEMKQLAKQCGISVPDGDIISLDEPILWSKFPAIIKPVASVEGAKSDIKTVHSSEEFVVAMDSFKKSGYSRVLVEEFIDGENSYMLEVMGSKARGNNPDFAGVIKKHREFPICNGSTSYASLLAEHEGIDFDKIALFLDSVNFSGLFDIEFKYKDQTAYFIESNFRNGAPAYAFTQEGINIPLNWIMRSIGENVVSKSHAFGKTFMIEQTDVLNMLKGQVPFFKWLKEFFTSKKVFFNWHDLKPVVRYYSMFIIGRLRKEKSK